MLHFIDLHLKWTTPGEINMMIGADLMMLWYNHQSSSLYPIFWSSRNFLIIFLVFYCIRAIFWTAVRVLITEQKNAKNKSWLRTIQTKWTCKHHNIIKSAPIIIFLAPWSLQIRWSLIIFIEVVKLIDTFFRISVQIMS